MLNITKNNDLNLKIENGLHNFQEIKNNIEKYAVIYQMANYIIKYIQESELDLYVCYFYNDNSVYFMGSSDHPDSFSIAVVDLLSYGIIKCESYGKDDIILRIKDVSNLIAYIEQHYEGYAGFIYS